MGGAHPAAARSTKNAAEGIGVKEMTVTCHGFLADEFSHERKTSIT
jgi:hypothetical protein